MSLFTLGGWGGELGAGQDYVRESGGRGSVRGTGGLGGTQEISGADAQWGSGRRVRIQENGETGFARAGAVTRGYRQWAAKDLWGGRAKSAGRGGWEISNADGQVSESVLLEDSCAVVGYEEQEVLRWRVAVPNFDRQNEVECWG